MSDKWLSDDELNNILGQSEESEEQENKQSDTENLLEDLLSENTNHENEKKVHVEPSANIPKEEIEIAEVKLEQFSNSESYDESIDGFDFSKLYDIPITIRVLLGSKFMSIEEILELKEKSIIKLDKLAGEPVEILAGEQIIAKGEMIIIPNDEKFGVRITEIIPPRERIRSISEKLKRQKN